MSSRANVGGGPPLVEHRGRGGRRTVAVAVSGGVDSATAARIMQQQGHEVHTGCWALGIVRLPGASHVGVLFTPTRASAWMR